MLKGTSEGSVYYIKSRNRWIAQYYEFDYTKNKTIDKIAKSSIADTKIDVLTSEEIQDYLNSLKDLSNSYIFKIYSQFSSSFKYAMKKGYIYKNPMDDVIMPKSKKPDKVVRALTFE